MSSGYIFFSDVSCVESHVLLDWGNKSKDRGLG